MLRTLNRLARRSNYYQHDSRLFPQVMRCNRVDMLECLHDLKLQYEYEGECTWDPNLMRIAL